MFNRVKPIKKSEDKLCLDRDNTIQRHSRKDLISSKRGGDYIKGVADFIYFSQKGIYKELNINIASLKNKLKDLFDMIESEPFFDIGREFVTEHSKISSFEMKHIAENISQEIISGDYVSRVFPYVYHELLLDYERGKHKEKFHEFCELYENIKN